ncbi:MAG: TIR domain-containing protein [Bacteroidetes bacterium]|nr:TIR domain-containing protein [Bacteroidota bacterium]
MARRVFFSFHYKQVWKVNQIRNIPNITGTAAAGFQDASLWEDAKKKGVKEIKLLIDKGLLNTSVTVVFVTYGVTNRKYINYEIDKSLERGNGLVAVQIHHLKDQNGDTGSLGSIPSKIKANGFKAYKYSNREALARWIEAAAKIAGK